jgi:hypothetical protein
VSEASAGGPDPVDGLRLALLQQRADEVRRQLGFRTFGMKEGLLVAMLASGITILAMASPGRSHTQSLVLGWALIVQAAGLYWSLRHSAVKELALLEKRIAAAAASPDARVIEAAAGAARQLLLRK